MPKRRNLHDWWSGSFDRLAHSYLVWAMVLVIAGFWLFNVRQLISEYADREENLIREYQGRLLERKREDFDDTFRLFALLVLPVVHLHYPYVDILHYPNYVFY